MNDWLATLRVLHDLEESVAAKDMARLDRIATRARRILLHYSPGRVGPETRG